MGAAAAGLLSSGNGAEAEAATTTTPTSDMMVVSETLAVEQVLVYSYEQVVGGGTLGAEAQQLASVMLGHERAHVAALTAELARLGGVPPDPPTSAAQANAQLAAHHAQSRLSGLRTELDALDFLYSIEAVAIGAHYQALEYLTDPQLLQTSAQIMGAQAQHAAAIGELLHPGMYARIVPIAYVKGKS